MFEFRNKTILIISPQSWGKMYISKHHYAIELAKKGNKVFFLNPPIRQFLPEISIQKSDIKNLFIIDNSYFFPYNLRFHQRQLFDKLQNIFIRFLLKKISSKIDVAWCFDTNLFSNFKIFNANISIYHPVDNILGNHQKKIIKSADFIFSVSDVIIENIKSFASNINVCFINHGLSRYFIDNKIEPTTLLKNNISAYFSGNLLINSLDRAITKQIIYENPNVQFIFLGSHTIENIGGDKEAEKFVHFLKEQKNVILKGAIHPSKVAKELQKADVLLVLIDNRKDINKGSNSHKIIEYLSVGKVIVSSHITKYYGKHDLIQMVDESVNDRLPVLFKKVINNLDYYNAPKFQQKRIEYALNNTYEKQIERIEQFISKNLNP